mmetsp:Transcript_38754/g.102702  ORF Transcript_38754/g.102702 Transcript_38754/m.102702 type:complete len:238 (-) Transcript_38754:408-1121(-)
MAGLARRAAIRPGRLHRSNELRTSPLLSHRLRQRHLRRGRGTAPHQPVVPCPLPVGLGVGGEGPGTHGRYLANRGLQGLVGRLVLLLGDLGIPRGLPQPLQLLQRQRPVPAAAAGPQHRAVRELLALGGAESPTAGSSKELKRLLPPPPLQSGARGWRQRLRAHPHAAGPHLRQQPERLAPLWAGAQRGVKGGGVWHDGPLPHLVQQFQCQRPHPASRRRGDASVERACIGHALLKL